MKKVAVIPILMSMLIIVVLVWGCTDSKKQQDIDITDSSSITSKTEEYSESHKTTEAPTNPPVETTPKLVGNFTLEDCKSTTGVFIAHEDGSFTKLVGGGYVDQEYTIDIGMYMQNKLVKKSPSIDKNDKIVVFCDSEYSLRMLPVNWEVGVIFTTENGVDGYTRAIKHGYGIDFYTYYVNHKTSEVNITHIDGISVDDYPFEIVGGENGESEGCGFPKGATIKIGVSKGSSIVETDAEVSATYFDCEAKYDNYGNSEDLHYLLSTPTTAGYAVIDVYDKWHNTEIPSGKYIMILDMGKKYIAYLIDWQNN